MRLSRKPSDPPARRSGVSAPGQSFWSRLIAAIIGLCAYIIEKGAWDVSIAAKSSLQSFREDIEEVAPYLHDRTGGIKGLE